MKPVRMPLAAFSIASFTIAAAAQCSSEGGAATLCTLVGIVFLLAYVMSSWASVIISVDLETLRTVFDIYGEVAKLTASPHFRAAVEQQ